jgi:hypothetical protein
LLGGAPAHSSRQHAKHLAKPIGPCIFGQPHSNKGTDGRAPARTAIQVIQHICFQALLARFVHSHTYQQLVTCTLDGDGRQHDSTAALKTNSISTRDGNAYQYCCAKVAPALSPVNASCNSSTPEVDQTMCIHVRRQPGTYTHGNNSVCAPATRVRTKLNVLQQQRVHAARLADAHKAATKVGVKPGCALARYGHHMAASPHC